MYIYIYIYIYIVAACPHAEGQLAPRPTARRRSGHLAHVILDYIRLDYSIVCHVILYYIIL